MKISLFLKIQNINKLVNNGTGYVDLHKITASFYKLIYRKQHHLKIASCVHGSSQWLTNQCTVPTMMVMTAPKLTVWYDYSIPSLLSCINKSKTMLEQKLAEVHTNTEK